MRPRVRLQVHMRQAPRRQQLQQVVCSLALVQGAAVRPWVPRPPQLHHQGPQRRQRGLLAGGQVRRKGQARCWVAPGHQGLRWQMQELQMGRQAQSLPGRTRKGPWVHTLEQRQQERRVAAKRATMSCNVSRLRGRQP